MANISTTISTKFYQNGTGFVDDLTKTFGVFWVRSSNCCSLTKMRTLSFTRYVATLFKWAGKHLNYFLQLQMYLGQCVPNFIRIPGRVGFVEDMTKTFWCIFSVRSVVPLCCRVLGHAGGRINIIKLLLSDIFWSLPKLVTLSELERRNDRQCALCHTAGTADYFWSQLRQSYRPTLLATKM